MRPRPAPRPPVVMAGPGPDRSPRRYRTPPTPSAAVAVGPSWWDGPVRLTVLGGGGFRVPLVRRALLTDTGPGRVDRLTLHDVDGARLASIGQVLREQAAGHPD